MRRTSLTIAAALLLTLILPVAGPDGAVAQGDTLATDVPILDEEGVTRGAITVREIEDPFMGFDAGQEPGDGMRYVGLIVAFTTADDQTLDADVYGVKLHDADGNLYSPTYIPRPADMAQPDLQSQEMAPGNRISGFIGLRIPADAVVDEIVYSPATYSAVSIVDIRRSAGPAAGQPVDYVADDGSQAQVTVSVEDPFAGFEPGSPPDAGSRFVGLYVAFENTGTLPFVIDPNQLYLRAADGSLIWPTSVYRPPGFSEPDLRYVAIAPGNLISAFAGYVVPESSTIAGVDLWSSSNRRVEIVDLGDGGPVPAATPTPPPEPQATVTRETLPTPSAAATPEASATPAPSAGVAT